MKRILVVFILLLIPSMCLGQSLGKDSLKGLVAVEVLVEGVGSEIEVLGLTTQSIKTDTELRLRKAGIKIAPKDSFSDEIGTLYVNLQVSEIAGGQGLYMFHGSVVIQQNTRLSRSPNLYSYAITYKVTGSYGTIGKSKLRELRNVIGDDVDVFINDYLEMNPKK